MLGDRYEIEANIGRGGMGEVFRAHDRRLDNEVAIKRLTPQLASSADLRTSLEREAQIMARLSDASIVRLFDLAEFYGDLYLILEYVPGPTLRDMIRSGYRASPQELAKIIGETCQGLTAAHDAGVVHRDLKPSNMLLALSGDDKAAFLSNQRLPANLAHARIKITDFGIAKAIADSHLTVTNAFSGTPGYMAPEQFRGELPSPQTDVYALGAVTYELLTGALPQQPIPDVPAVHPAVTQVIRKALSPARQNRFPSAAAYYEALYNGIEGRSPFPRVPVPARRASKVPLLAVLFSGLLVLLIAIRVIVESTRPAHMPLGSPSKEALMPKPVFPKRPPPIDWHPFAKVSEPPPPVDEARGASGDPLGPEHPKVEWETILAELRPRIAGIGKDGTVYLVEGAQICAVRAGKLQWAYRSTEFAASIQEFDMDRDGRVWFKMHVIGEYERYCFNRDGQGGRLPRSYENQGPRHADESLYSCWKNKHTLSGPKGDMDIDDDCHLVAAGHDENIWVATDKPAILRVNKQRGRIESTYKTACEPSQLIPTLAGQLVFLCPDGTLHQTNGESEVWSHSSEGKIAYAKATTDGTVYFADRNKTAEGGHVHAIDTKGKLLWTVDLPRAPDGSIVIGQRRIYLFQMVNDLTGANRLISLAD